MSGASIPSYLISAIVSTYNSGRFLRGCLEDLLSQTIASRLEIIVVDSGSTENEGAIVREFQRTHPNIAYLRTETRETVYAAWNRGIRAAHGRYLTNANTDDRHRKDAFEIMCGALDDHPEIALAYADLIVTECENETFDRHTKSDEYAWSDWSRNMLLDKGCFIGPQPVWRRAVHDIYGFFDESLTVSGDYEFWLRISQTFDFMHIKIPLGLYLKSPYSIEHSNEKTKEMEDYRVISMYRTAAEEGTLVKFRPLEKADHGNGPDFSFSAPYMSCADHDLLQNENREGAVKFMTGKILRQTDWWVQRTAWIEDDLSIYDKKLASVKLSGLSSYDFDTSIVIAVPGLCGPSRFKDFWDRMTLHTVTGHETIFVVEKGSPALSFLPERGADISLVTIGPGCSLAEAFNHGITASRGKNIVAICAGVKVTGGWLDAMLECLESTGEECIVGAMLGGAQGIQGSQDYLEEGFQGIDEFALFFSERNRFRRIETSKMSGLCMLFRRSLPEKIGLFDADLNTAEFSSDFCLRASLRGFRSFFAAVFLDAAEVEWNTAPKAFLSDKWSGLSALSELGKKLIALQILELSDTFFQKGKTGKYVEALSECIKSLPYNKELYYRLALYLLDSGQYKAGINLLDTMTVGMFDARRLELMGYCKEGINIDDEAVQCTDRILSSGNKSVRALNLKGRLALKRSGHDEAERFFVAAMDADRSDGEAYSNLGMLLCERGELDKGYGLAERGFILSPLVRRIAGNYRSAINLTGRLERAEDIVRNARRIFYNNRNLLAFHIDLLLRRNKHGLAMDEIENLLVDNYYENEMISMGLRIRKQIGPKNITGNPGKRKTLSLCMIVKNEEMNIGRCLNSIKSVADEIIVVDTGSSDRTKAIAEVFGAKVFDFGWNDNFSDARNCSLSFARGDYIFVLDADEVISKRDFNVLEAMLLNDGDLAYQFVTRNYVSNINLFGWQPNDGWYKEEAGTGWFPTLKVRLFPNDERIFFKHPVHELVEDSLKDIGCRMEIADLPVHHYGFVDSGQEQNKSLLYYRYGKSKLEKEPENVNAMIELALIAAGLRKYEEAKGLFERILILAPDMVYAYCNLVAICLKTGSYKEALAAAKKGINLASGHKEMIVNYALAELHAGDDGLDGVISIVDKAFKENPDYPNFHLMLSALFYITRNREAGLEHARLFNGSGLNYASQFHAFAESLLSAGRPDYAGALLFAIVDNGDADDRVKELLTKCGRETDGTC
ncbi:MAG: glycosyltransferase [Nitrospirae bacterium]|nr:MAG: glycosyltransferase [Nitrospirota bacterium]